MPSFVERGLEKALLLDTADSGDTNDEAGVQRPSQAESYVDAFMEAINWPHVARA